MTRTIGWTLFLTEPLLRHRLRILRARVSDVARVALYANVLVADWAVRRLGGEGDRDE